MFKAGVGSSVGVDPYREGVNAAKQAVDVLAGTPVKAVLVFASVQYDQAKVIEGVRSVVGPNAVIAGASTAGEITTQGPSNKPSIAVMAFAADGVEFYGAVGEHIRYNPTEAGKDVAQKVKTAAGGNVDLFMMFPDVLAGNGADIVRGVTEVLGSGSMVVGGAAGDDFKFEKTYQYLNDTVYSGAVVGLGIKGKVLVGVGVKHGWMPIGVPRKVTKSQGAVLYELDGKPAIDIYKEYFGDLAQELEKEKLAKLAVTYPLGMKIKDHPEMLIRDPLSVDSDGSITCAAEMPEGADIQLMIGSVDEAVKVAEEAAKNAVKQLKGATPRAVIIFNCIARHKLFGERSGEEISAIQRAVGKDTPLIGFYTYGEQAPLEDGEVKNIKTCNAEFHNETVVICVLGE